MRCRFLLPFSMLILLVGACGGSAPELPPPAADAVRETRSGSVVGFVDAAGGHTWRGIPFAAPPVGGLRWREPQPAPPWSGTREALAGGAPCSQIAGPAGAPGPRGTVGGSEDCLFLDVYAPRMAPDELPKGLLALPVMVWIHGGGNSQGSALLYDGSALATSRGVVVVAIQYRLGAFGWFRHPALHGADATGEDRSGNYGTLDAIFALEWVRDNIARFGGDPGRVTIFGESAGGANVLALLRSPRARGLFHRAIAQSGSARGVTVAEAENRVDAPEPGDANSSGEILLRALERHAEAADRSEAVALADAMGDAEIESLLRGLSPEDLVALYPVDDTGGLYPGPRLLRDGIVLSGLAPLEAYAGGDYNRVPVILGTNRDETKTFQLLSSPHLRRIGFVPLMFRDARMYDLLAEYGSRLWKARGADEPATAMRAVQGPSVYGYRFDWDDEPGFLWLDARNWLGAGHAIEIPFVFARLSLGPLTRLIFDPDRAEADTALSRAMTSYWTQLAYVGDPGRGRDGDLPHWTAWDLAGGSFLVLDSEDDGGIHMSGDTVTREAIVAHVADDPRLESVRERCEVYREMARWGGVALSLEDYATVEDGRCAELLPPPVR